MRVATFKRWRGLGWGFEGVRELTIPVKPAGSVKDSLRASPFVCHRGGPVITILDCMRCEHFVNWRPDPETGRAAVRCLFTDDDPVRDLMTPVDAVVAVAPDVSLADADEIARRNDVRHLLVAHGDEVLGVICRCDFTQGRRDARVGEIVQTSPWCVKPTAMLSEVATLFRNEGIGMALVVDGDSLLGLVTRGDLRRAGCPEDMLGARYCSCCKSAHGVIEHPSLGVDICIDCLESCADEVELGDGD